MQLINTGLLDWLINPEALLVKGIPPTPEASLYVNHLLAGGAASGPVDGNNPPTAHQIGFNTVSSFPEDQQNTAFKWILNDAKESGRSFMQYDLAANNPSLEVGSTYVFTVIVKSDVTTRAVTVSGPTNITVNEITFQAQAGVNTTLEVELTVNDVGYGGSLRYGVGVTTNREERMEVYAPKLVKKPSTGGEFTAEFTAEFT
jgi:hypothetical protein